MNNQNNQPAAVVVASTKSTGISILLTIFFGPLGMFYSTISGTLIFLLLAITLIVAALAVTPFLMPVVILLLWIISIIWGAMATKSYNTKLIDKIQN